MLSNHSKPYNTAFLFVRYRFMSLIPIMGMFIHLQHLSSNVFLLQCLYGVIAIPANALGNFSMNHMGRRITQLIFLSLLGIFILSTIFLSQGENRIQDEHRKYPHPFLQICQILPIRNWGKGHPLDLLQAVQAFRIHCSINILG